MKALAAGIGVVFLSPILIAGTGMMLASSADAVQSSGSFSNCLSDIDSDKVAEQVTKILDGASGKNVHIKGLDLPAEQVPNAATIVATGLSLDVPKKGRIVALATAMQESRLRNLGYGDRDSLGLFQQRPSQGWGSAQQIRDPVYASEQFYKHLLKVNGWQQMTITQAAQAVQKSGLPNAYAQWENLATALQEAIAKTFPGGHDADGKGADQGKQPSTGTTGCAPGQDGSGFGRIPEGSVPKGYAIPTNAESLPWLARIRDLGVPAAYAAQDGCDAPGLLPWDDFDVLFLAGSTEWKLGPVAEQLAREAKARSKGVHMGRVNSRIRLGIAEWFGCDSADGTYLAFGPDKNLPKLLSWLDELDGCPSLIGGTHPLPAPRAPSSAPPARADLGRRSMPDHEAATRLKKHPLTARTDPAP
ncbi:hypothetical protein, partial [Streptomyces brasiliscabiei]|uniref:hypothetical protein n=1 Tax=Streptomyces brasiliscabiei TaxID=2736302 RepID=UPI00301528B5